MTDKMFRYLNHTSVEGLDLIFKVLCLMCKIMIYRLPIRDSIDKIWVNKFEDELNEIMREMEWLKINLNLIGIQLQQI